MKFGFFSLAFSFGIYLSAQSVTWDWCAMAQHEFQIQASGPNLECDITDAYWDKNSAVWHVYLSQKAFGYVIEPQRLAMHIDAQGTVLFKTGVAVKKLSEKITANSFRNTEISIAGAYLKSVLHSEVALQQINTRTDEAARLQVNSSQTEIIESQKAFYYDENTGQLIAAFKLVWQRPDEHSVQQIIVADEDVTVLQHSERVLSCELIPGQFSMNQNRIVSVSAPFAAPDASYRVFAQPTESPSHGSRTLIVNPHLLNPDASPLGWHDDGSGSSTYTRGNNCLSYEDRDANNAPEADSNFADGGADLRFDFPLHIDTIPEINKDASVSNLFYWNNIMHDVWHRYGFDELSGNFQADNFYRGGLSGDRVKAETLDDIWEARNNANFYTPSDGTSPVMQMYVWQQPVYDTIICSTLSGFKRKVPYIQATVSKPLKSPFTGTVVLADDGSSAPQCACEALKNGALVKGKIVLIDRGICTFNAKIARAIAAGATGVIIANNVNTAPFVISGYLSSAGVPVVMISQQDGDWLKSKLSDTLSAQILPTSKKLIQTSSATIELSQADFGVGIPKYLSAEAILVRDLWAPWSDACDSIVNSSELQGNIALIDKANCYPDLQALHAQKAGAVAVVMMSDSDEYPSSLDNSSYGSLIQIPVMQVSATDAAILMQHLNKPVSIENRLPPLLDGSFDAGIICHEYAHGISNRLTGGPSTVSCLDNVEQAGEGWSDYFGLFMTSRPSDYPYLNRGVGTWPSGHPQAGIGVRPTPYNVDLKIDPADYSQLNDLQIISQPHGIGYIWCSMLWDLHWAFIKTYGNEQNVYNSGSSKGNIKVARLVMEGLKLQTCSPGFVDSRNAILKADSLLFGGANSCIIWNVFARRGLGFSANQGSSFRRNDGVAAYNLPPGCVKMNESELFGSIVLAAEDLSLYSTALQDAIRLSWTIDPSLRNLPWKLVRRAEGQSDEMIVAEGDDAHETLAYVDVKVSKSKRYHYQIRFFKNDVEVRSDWVTAILKQDRSSVIWSLYPNPARDFILLKSKDPVGSRMRISLYEMDGKLIDQNFFYKGSESEFRINISDLIPGHYVVQCIGSGGSENLVFEKK